jgi:hypothetical protein
MGVGVIHSHHDRVGDLALARGAAVAAQVRHDQGAVAEAELGAVVLPIRSRSAKPTPR